jgi:hypothetical protein
MCAGQLVVNLLLLPLPLPLHEQSVGVQRQNRTAKQR